MFCWMQIRMQNREVLTREQLNDFLRGTEGVNFVGQKKEEVFKCEDEAMQEKKEARFANRYRPSRAGRFRLRSAREKHGAPAKLGCPRPPAGRHRGGVVRGLFYSFEHTRSQDLNTSNSATGAASKESPKPKPSYEGKPKHQGNPQGLPLVGIGSSKNERKERQRTIPHFNRFHDHFSIGKCWRLGTVFSMRTLETVVVAAWNRRPSVPDAAIGARCLTEADRLREFLKILGSKSVNKNTSSLKR